MLLVQLAEVGTTTNRIAKELGISRSHAQTYFRHYERGDIPCFVPQPPDIAKKQLLGLAEEFFVDNLTMKGTQSKCRKETSRLGDYLDSIGIDINSMNRQHLEQYMDLIDTDKRRKICKRWFSDFFFWLAFNEIIRDNPADTIIPEVATKSQEEDEDGET